MTFPILLDDVTKRAGQRFYLDATNGDDDNVGTSPSLPWQTIAKINSSTFNPGHRILFKRGETWAGTCLTVPSSGAAGLPILFAAYGGGADPIIDGEDTVNCITANTKNYLKFQTLDLTQGLDSGLYLVDATHVDVIDVDMHDAGNDNLLIYTDCSYITVLRGNYYNAYQRVAATINTGIEITDGSHDIVIDGPSCYNNTGAGSGISIHSHSGTVMPYNITIRNADLYSNDNHGLNIFKQDNTADTDRNILIENTKLRLNTQEGTRITQNGGERPIGITFDICELTGNTRYAGYCEADDLTFKRSLIHEGRMLYVQKFKRLVLYNNTFYLTTWANYGPLQLDPWGADARTDEATIKNNIFASPDAGTYIGWCADIPNLDYDYNLYDRANDTDTRWRFDGSLKNYADWKTAISGDTNSLDVQSASFTDAANDDFSLADGSPCINAGVDVGLDYNGAAPDLGYLETT